MFVLHIIRQMMRHYQHFLARFRKEFCIMLHLNNLIRLMNSYYASHVNSYRIYNRYR